MMTNVSTRVAGVIVAIATWWVASGAAMAQGADPAAAKARDPSPKVRISINTGMLFTSPTPGQVLVFGDVASIVQNETITYWPKISLEAVHTEKKSVLTSTWTWRGKTDKDVFTVKPGETNRLFCVAGGQEADNQTLIVQYSGKGIIRIYVTEKPDDPIGARISNLLTLAVDLDSKTAKIIEDQPQPEP